MLSRPVLSIGNIAFSPFSDPRKNSSCGSTVDAIRNISRATWKLNLFKGFCFYTTIPRSLDRKISRSVKTGRTFADTSYIMHWGAQRNTTAVLEQMRKWKPCMTPLGVRPRALGFQVSFQFVASMNPKMSTLRCRYQCDASK